MSLHVWVVMLGVCGIEGSVWPSLNSLLLAPGWSCAKGRWGWAGYKMVSPVPTIVGCG